MNLKDVLARSSGFGVAQVRVENAVDEELGLDKIPLAMDTLVALARRGGTAPFPKTRVHTKRPHPITGLLTDCVIDLLPMIQKLEALGLVEAVLPAVTTAEHGYVDALLRLTEKGGNVVDAFAKKRIVVGEVKNITIGQAIDDGKALAAQVTEQQKQIES